MLQVGASAPEAVLPAHTLERMSLAELYAHQTTVLIFFPLAFTSTCTEELCTMRDDMQEYAELDAQVLAISVDSPWVLDRYRNAVDAEYTFLSDFNREASTAFGVLRDGTLGPGLRGASDRAAFVVDRGGTIRYAWRSTNPSLLPPFDELKAAVRALAR